MVASMSDKLKSTWNAATPEPTTVTSVRTSGTGTLACLALNWPTDTAVDFATYSLNTDGSPNQASVQEFTGIVSGTNLTSIEKTSGGADAGNNIGDIVVMKPTAKGHQDLVDAMKVAHNQDGSLKDDIVTAAKIADDAVTSAAIAQSAKDLLGSYSTSEVATSYKWTDGKTIYKKTISFNSIATSTSVAHGISIDTPISISVVRSGTAMGNGYHYSDTSWIYFTLDATNVVIRQGSGISTTNPCTATLFYTKV